MEVQWQLLPDGLDERFSIKERGKPFLAIQIVVANYETGETRLGSMDGVEATARKEDDGRITLFAVGQYAELASATADEVLAALLDRLSTPDWGVKMTTMVVDVPAGVFA